MWFTSLSKPAHRLLALGLLGLLLPACSGNPASPSSADTNTAAVSPAATPDAAVGDSNHAAHASQPGDSVRLASAPDQEAAETLVAVHFSRRNTRAGYPLYKGLTITIDSTGSSADSAWVAARVQGRQRHSPSDSTTRPFQEQIRLKAYRNGLRWEEKPLP